jgi:hypothetical protein
LTFRRHQLVKVYGNVDGNGYVWAEMRRHYGLVPAGKLVELAPDDLFLTAEESRSRGRKQQQQQSWAAANATGGGPRTGQDQENVMGINQIKKLRAHRECQIEARKDSCRLYGLWEIGP